VTPACLEAEARSDHADFFLSRITAGRPAGDAEARGQLDGRIATATGESRGSPAPKRAAGACDAGAMTR
jgi:hypothetical protein